MRRTAYRCTGCRATASTLSTSVSMSLHLTLCMVPTNKEDAAKIVDSVKKKIKASKFGGMSTHQSHRI